MAEEENVHIKEWPKQKARLEHHFKLEKPCPVSIKFEDDPAYLHLKTDSEDPLDVNMDMDMNVKADEDIPVCIKLCEPICATSDYEIGINLLGRPLASISVNGSTVFDHCEADDQPSADRECIDFIDARPKKDSEPPYVSGIASFSPLQDELLAFITSGAPAGQMKLAIPDSGLSIDFSQPVKELELEVTNYGQASMQFTSFMDGSVVQTKDVVIENQQKTVSLEGEPVNRIEIKGGSNEASLSSVCYKQASMG